MQSIQRTNEEIAEIYRRNIQSVFRVCALFFHGDAADAEDAVQTTFLKLINDSTRFRSLEHEKAFLIVTAGNVCKDMRKHGWRKNVDLDGMALEHQEAMPSSDKTLRAVMELPERLKTAIYLHYYEGYGCREIANYLGRTESSVWRYLKEGRDLLKEALKEDF